MIDYKEGLEKVIEMFIKDKGGQKEVEGLFEELPGEIGEVIQEQIFQDVRYVVVDRLIHAAAIQELDFKKLDKLIGDISLLVCIFVMSDLLGKIAEPPSATEIGYA